MKDNKKEYIKKDYFVESNKKRYEVVEDIISENVGLHFHDYLEAELILSGDATQYINDYKTFISRGSFSLLRPDIDCHSVEVHDLSVIKFYVKPYIIDPELWNEISLLLDPLVVKLEGEELEHAINLFKLILFEQNRAERHREEIIKNGINLLLCLFVQKKVGSEHNITTRMTIMKYLVDNDRYLTDVSLQDFANDFGYSLSHASKYFKENTGMTFSEAKQYFRIQVAKRLLLSTNYSINEIATICGFNYYHLFHNVFKKSTGMTPFEFKKNNR